MTIAAYVRIVWLLTGAVFFGLGVGVVWWPNAQTIAAVSAQSRALYDEANQNEAEVRHAAQLRAVARQIAGDVRSLSGEGSQSAAMAATLALLGREGRAFSVDVRSILPAPEASAMPSPGPAERALAGTPLEIDVRGSFRDILAFVSDLPRHDALIEVHELSLSDRGDRSPKHILGASIYATVFRYGDGAERETQHASRAS
ncbi:MAG TPA: type 4a pilus biogenesis protein PilO [Candidatus Acidoferrales bacterium]|nr:type 4a pilus biogenesis protein PilO [Candidatus Acidoferrales bacterium]